MDWSRTLMRAFLKPARVAGIETIAANFRLIALESPAFREHAWAPGQKIQIAMGSAFTNRTYTPIEWDRAEGRTRVLAYAHGEGPGSAWIRALQTGDSCDVFGPRASLDAPPASARAALFGDETSLGLAHALQRRHARGAFDVLLEVRDLAGAARVVDRLGMEGVTLTAAQADGTHLAAIEARLCEVARGHAHLVLTGKAQSIKPLRQALRAGGVPSSRIETKAYWAVGKRGLD
ncbi:siderophore-interacting protein [Paraburkholderia acidisoli]|uniref:Siderophore-interacting protein n=1 Tax=Paraburkholderia acidisoli TaxID=2571748 RepID=A0A7Z2JKW1_9BURK|nr:siderophore-interacting protein [Paraburkholderia acidisoli]QGZ66684.1 siderophore-interacting protein [Paraburkholderia acidisoli]